MDPLIIALPKGRMQIDALELFDEIGFPVDQSAIGRKLVFDDETGRLRFILAKPSDVPTYVEYGAADLGIVGQDTLRESDWDLYEPLALGFAKCHLSLAGPPEMKGVNLRLISGLRVASKYPNLAIKYLESLGVSAEVIYLSGSVELGPATGLTDLLVDLVQTGKTLVENGLIELETVIESQAVLVVNRASHKLRFEAIQELVNELARCVEERRSSDD